MARSERSVQLSFRVEGEVLDRLLRAAASEHRSMANYAKHVLIERLSPLLDDVADTHGERALGE